MNAGDRLSFTITGNDAKIDSKELSGLLSNILLAGSIGIVDILNCWPIKPFNIIIRT